MRNGSSWTAFAVLFAARTAIAYQFESVGALDRDLSQLFDLDRGQIGLLIGFHMLPGIILALPSGLIGARYSSRYAIILGLVLMTIGGFGTSGESTPLLFIGRIVSGVGAVLMNIYLTKMVADWFAPEKLGSVMGSFVTSWPLGIALALVTLPWLAARYGTHTAMLAPTVASAACLLGFLAIYKDPTSGSAGGEQPEVSWNLPTGLWGRIIAAGAVWGAYNAAYVLFVTAMPAILEQNGYDRELAAGTISLFGWSLMITLPLGGVLIDRFSDPRTGVHLALLAVLTGVACILFSRFLLTGAIIVALMIGIPAGALLSLSSRLLEQRFRLAGMGGFFLMFYGAMTLSPAVTGLLVKMNGDITGPIQVAALAIALSMLGFEVAASSRSKEAAAIES